MQVKENKPDSRYVLWKSLEIKIKPLKIKVYIDIYVINKWSTHIQ